MGFMSFSHFMRCPEYGQETRTEIEY